jgi:hypothetical protein
VKLNFAIWFFWANAIGLIVAAFGALPTWHYHGRDGLASLVAAGAVSWTVMAICGMAMVVMSIMGPSRTAFAFVMSGMLRLVGALGGAGLVILATDLPLKPLLIWLGVFYFCLLMVEAVWLGLAMNEDFQQVALGNLPPADRRGLSLPGPGGR